MQSSRGYPMRLMHATIQTNKENHTENTQCNAYFSTNFYMMHTYIYILNPYGFQLNIVLIRSIFPLNNF